MGKLSRLKMLGINPKERVKKYIEENAEIIRTEIKSHYNAVMSSSISFQYWWMSNYPAEFEEAESAPSTPINRVKYSKLILKRKGEWEKVKNDST